MPFAELRPLCASPPRSRPEISVEPSVAADLLAIHLPPLNGTMEPPRRKSWKAH
jgi:hypothetical protein